METGITDVVYGTDAVEVVKEMLASSRHTVWLPIHFGPAVSSLGLYFLLNIGVLLLGRLANLLDPAPRERLLRRSVVAAVVAFLCVVGWSICLVVSQHRLSTAFVPPSPAWCGFAEEVLRQMTVFYILPAVVSGVIGMFTIGWLWRNAKKALQSLPKTTERGAPTHLPGGIR
jgi:hypothetical protein